MMEKARFLVTEDPKTSLLLDLKNSDIKSILLDCHVTCLEYLASTLYKVGLIGLHGRAVERAERTRALGRA